MKRNRVGDKKYLPPPSAVATSATVIKHGKSKRTQKIRWTQEEDMRLQRTVLDYLKETNTDHASDSSISWKTIAERLTGRSGKQCRERWSNHVNPEIKTDPWTEEEEILIVKLQREKGNSWKDISQFLTGRSDNAIKNHWHSMRRRKHKLIVESQIGSLGEGSGGRGGGAAGGGAKGAVASTSRVLVPSSRSGAAKKAALSKNKAKQAAAGSAAAAAAAAAARAAPAAACGGGGGGSGGRSTGVGGGAKVSAFIKAAGSPRAAMSGGKKKNKSSTAPARKLGKMPPHHFAPHAGAGGAAGGGGAAPPGGRHLSSSKENLNGAFQSIDVGRGGLNKSHDIFLMDNASPPPYMPSGTGGAVPFMVDAATPPTAVEIVQILKGGGSSGGGVSTPAADTKNLSNLSYRSLARPESISSLSSDGIMHGMLNMSEMSSTRLTPDLARSMNFDDMAMPAADAAARTPPMISPLTLRSDQNGMEASGGGGGTFPKILQSGDLDDVSWDTSFEANGSPIVA